MYSRSFTETVHSGGRRKQSQYEVHTMYQGWLLAAVAVGHSIDQIHYSAAIHQPHNFRDSHGSPHHPHTLQFEFSPLCLLIDQSLCFLGLTFRSS